MTSNECRRIADLIQNGEYNLTLLRRQMKSLALLVKKNCVLHFTFIAKVLITTISVTYITNEYMFYYVKYFNR